MKTLESKRRYWQEHVAAWQRSGLTQVDYCTQHGLVPKQLGYRVKKDRQRNTVDNRTPAVTLVPVQIQGTSNPDLMLQHPGGWQLTLSSNVSVAWLTSLLRGLT